MSLKKIVCLVVSAVILIGIIPAEAYYSAISNFATPNKEYYKENSQTYISEDGTEHKIYWAQGIEPPKMTSDENQYGKDGYFHKNVTGPYVSYEAPINVGSGYYDLNKDPAHVYEKNLCYLASAVNLIHWWMDQNSDLIDIYLKQLQDGVYGQHDGLKNIIPYNQTLWENIRKPAPISYLEGYGNGQLIGTSELMAAAFTPYYLRDDGYYPDCVYDYFFNGYPAIKPGQPPEINAPTNFTPDSRGGFFYPIFGAEILSTRNMDNKQSSSYSYYNSILKDLLNGGKGVSISFYIETSAHAINVWGAEYDSKGNLCRIYVTDSNDISNRADNSNYTRGMHSLETYEESGSGRMYITANTDPNAKKGPFVQGITTLDLAKEKFESKLKDTSNPNVPTVTKQPQNAELAKGANHELSVIAESKDTGYITYQWYMSDSETAEGTLIKGAVFDKYSPDTSSLGTKYYYCILTNNKNGKTTVKQTNYARVDCIDIPLVHAEKPSVSFNYNTVTETQFMTPSPIKVKANVSDGGTLTYQWYRTYDNTAANGTPIKGETREIFYPPTNSLGRYFYYCVVTNTNENVTGEKQTSAATAFAKNVTVKEGEFNYAQNPVFVTHPKANTYEQNAKAEELNFDFRLFDNGKVSYQWYVSNSESEDGTPIQGATNPTYTPLTDKPGDFYYYCVVTNNNTNAKIEQVATSITRTAKITVNGIKPVVPPTITSDKITVENGFATEIKAGITADELLNLINEKDFIEIQKDGKAITGNEKVGTGTVIILKDGDQTKDTVTVVIKHDIDGDGNITEQDFNKLKDANLGKTTLEGAYLKSADCNGDGKITVTDLLQLKANILGKPIPKK